MTAADPRWRTFGPALLLLLAGVLFVYRDTGLAMVSIWSRSETFTHAFVVPPIVLWLIWRQRDVLAALTPKPSAWVLLPMACVGLLWLLGELASVNAATQLAFTALLVLCVPAMVGWPVTRAILFPLAFLFFAVPTGEFLMPLLMSWTADFTVLALRLSGIPVYREGQNFVIPSGNWSVVEACSGVRYLIASVMVGTLFAYLNYHSLRRRLIFVGVAILVPVLANWVRAYLIVLLGHVSDNKLAAGADHLIYGWAFFGVVILLMFMIGARWSEPDAPPVVRAATAVGTAANRWQAAAWGVVATAAVLVLLPQLTAQSLDRRAGHEVPRMALPERLAMGWKADGAAVPAWTPVFLNPAAQSHGVYGSDGRQVAVYIAYYRAQREGHKLVSSDNVLVKSNDRNWAVVGRDTRTIDIGGQPLTLRTERLRPPPGSGRESESGLVAWQVYWIDDTLTASDQRAKLHGALSKLRGLGDDGAAIVISTRADTPGGADVVLAGFLRDNLSEIQARLRQTRDTAPASP
jgi:exosortase A